LRYSQKSRFNLSVASESTFIASHFSEFKPDNLQRRAASELEMIVNRQRLVVESEDWFLDLIFSFGSNL
jgi:hypothetical protein